MRFRFFVSVVSLLAMLVVASALISEALEQDGDSSKQRKAPVESVNHRCKECHSASGGDAYERHGAAPPGEVACLDCHWHHEDKVDQPTLRLPLEEACFSCHEKTRGTLGNTFYHASVSLTVACIACHKLHGAQGPGLLKDSLTLAAVVAATQPVDIEQAPIKPPAGYVGTERCIDCHIDFARAWKEAFHSKVLLDKQRPVEQRGCEACHGPGSEHVAFDRTKIVKPAKLGTRESAHLCLACHRDRVQEGTWQTGIHAASGLTCVSCHDIHQKPLQEKMLRLTTNELCFSCHEEKRAQFSQVSHHPLLEGRTTCSECHDPHGSARDSLLREPTAAVASASGNDINDLCVSCHSEKGGPFLFEHDPVSGGLAEGCLTCHNPHGSPNTKLLVLAGRGVCLQCHTDIVANPAFSFMSGYCVRCHRRIHGSDVDERFLD